jgi:hypothetical protein
MSLIMPYGMNSALKRRDSPWGAFAGDVEKRNKNLERLAKIAKSAEPDPHEKAETVGKMIMSGALRVGSGPNGNAALRKRAQTSGFPITSDAPERARLSKAVGEALAGLRGSRGHPAMGWVQKGTVAGGVGARVRALKAANDGGMAPMLPGVQAPTINDNALDVLNALPDGRARQAVVSVMTARPPANPSDAYRWLQSVVALREQITEMCEEMGLDPTALTDLLDRKVDFYDPMAQSGPATAARPRSNVGPTTEDLDAWRDRADPPAEEIDPRDFAGSNRTDMNPDFAEEKLAKFWSHAKRGVDIRKGEDGSREQLERYGLVVVKSEIDGALQKQILAMHAARKRAGPRVWSQVTREPHYEAILESIATHPHLTRAMKGAAVALIT